MTKAAQSPYFFRGREQIPLLIRLIDKRFCQRNELGRKDAPMKRRHALKVTLLVLLTVSALALSGCVVGGGIENTSPNDLTFPDINTVINPATATPAPNYAQPTDSVVPDPYGNGNIWNAPTPTIYSINLPSSIPQTLVTPAPTAKPSATPQGSLKLGSTGQQVKEVQQMLKNLGYYSGAVDGDFGAGTENAVKAFQKQNGLEADGKVGTQTLAKLQAAKATAKPTASPTPAFNDNTYLRNGNSGAQVRQLQERLISLGYLLGKSTSNFDNATEAAVIAFQNRNTSYADGVAGPETLRALYSSNARKASSPAGIIGSSLREGDGGEEVRLLQERLKRLGYYSGNVDGDFGAGTVNAVKAFQRQNGLTADGVAGSGTLSRLFSSSAKSYTAPTATPRPTPTRKPTATPRATSTPLPPNIYVLVTAAPGNDYATLRRGMYGTPVQQMQEELKKQGFYTGVTDGYFGEGTENAVKAFQRTNGLYVDGAAGPATLRVLFEGDFPFGS